MAETGQFGALTDALLQVSQDPGGGDSQLPQAPVSPPTLAASSDQQSLETPEAKTRRTADAVEILNAADTQGLLQPFLDQLSAIADKVAGLVSTRAQADKEMPQVDVAPIVKKFADKLPPELFAKAQGECEKRSGRINKTLRFTDKLGSTQDEMCTLRSGHLPSRAKPFRMPVALPEHQLQLQQMVAIDTSGGGTLDFHLHGFEMEFTELAVEAAKECMYIASQLWRKPSGAFILDGQLKSLRLQMTGESFVNSAVSHRQKPASALDKLVGKITVKATSTVPDIGKEKAVAMHQACFQTCAEKYEPEASKVENKRPHKRQSSTAWMNLIHKIASDLQPSKDFTNACAIKRPRAIVLATPRRRC